MCKKIKVQYVINHFDGSFKSTVCVCNTLGKAIKALPVVAKCVAQNYSLEIVHAGEQAIDFDKGRVWIEEIPIVTDNCQIFNLFCMPEE